MSQYLASPQPLDLRGAGAVDPLARFGQVTARRLIAQLRALPAAGRAEAMDAVLRQIDPSLPARLETAYSRARGKGEVPRAALERALAGEMKQGAVAELAKIGRRGTTAGALALGVETRDHRGTDQTTTHGGSTPPTANLTLAQVGPFTFTIGTSGSSRIRIHQDQIPAAWKAWLVSQAKTITVHPEWWRNDPPTTSASSVGLDKWIGMAGGTLVARDLFNGSAPIFRTTGPQGQNMGVFLTATPSMFEAYLRPVPEPGFWGKLWGAIKYVASKFWDGVKWVAGAIKDATCALAQNPLTTAAASGAAGPAGAAGVQIVAQLCQPATPPQILPPPSSSIPWVPIAIGGGALLVLLAATR